MKRMILLSAVVCMAAVTGQAQTPEEIARTKMAELTNLVTLASGEGIDTRKEELALRTSEIFLHYADWDEMNVSFNSNLYALSGGWKSDPLYWAQLVPDFQRNDISTMVDSALTNLTRLRNGEISREPIPDIDWSQVTHDGDQLTYNGRPVFLAYYTWKPDVPEYNDFHGDADGFFIMHPYVLNDAGDINASKEAELAAKPSGTVGFIFLNHKNAPDWAETKYGPGFRMRENTYTAYDIDNPGAREMNQLLLDGVVPYMAGKKYSELGYMLCNEPHFYTTKKADTSDPADWDWASGPVSDYTKDKFRTWLSQRHATIADLNTLWGTSFATFNDVTIDIPIYNGEQGAPKWYDWQRFNNERVTEWYTWLKSAIRTNDPGAKVHLKIMPNLWTENKRGHGIDFEALSNLSEILGNDASTDYNNWWGKTLEWEDRYAYGWREQSMGYDFLKSVSPDKIVFNTESHLLSTGSSRDLYMDPDYVRATFWLGHMHGLTASQIWFWARREDGSPRNGLNIGTGYWGSNNYQPRVVNEVHDTTMDLNAHAEEIMAMQRQRKPLRIFYSETSALNKAGHMDEVFELYEALYFEGVSIGFATENIINTQSNSLWDAVLVRNTAYVTTNELAALQSYLDNGGTIIIDAVSLQYDEYGRALGTTLAASNGTLLTETTLSGFKTEALNVVASHSGLPEVSISETNGIGVKGCVWKCIKNSTGNNVLSIVNVGKTDAALSIQMPGSTAAFTCVDLLTGAAVSSSPTLKPFEVFFVELKPAGYSEVTVQWGEPGGDSNIVTNHQDFSAFYNTYTVGNTVNPTIGPAYYPSHSGRSPVFNHAAKNAWNVKQVRDGGGAAADYITTAKNDADYTAMVVWENELSGQETLNSLEIETRVNNSADTSSQFRWLIQKSDGSWYASEQTDTTGSYVLYTTSDPAVLTWYDFTPHNAGTAVVGAPASIDMSGITAVGYYATFQQPVSVVYRASETRYFKAVASSGTAATGWDQFVSAYGLSGSVTNDFDGDGQLDIVEYALGGNPTNAAEQGQHPSLIYHSDSNVSFYNLEVTNADPGITYQSEWTTNLVTGPWTNLWNLETNYPAIDPEFNEARHRVWGGDKDELFFRLKLLAP